MAIPSHNNNGPGMFNAHDGQGSLNANSGPGTLFSSDKQDIHYTVNHNHFYGVYPSDPPRDMPRALPWHREPSTNHTDHQRHHRLDSSRNQTGGYEPPQHHRAEAPSFRPSSSIAASLLRVPDPSNRYSTGRPSFPQRYNPNDLDDDYITDQISHRGYGLPSRSPGPAVRDYRRPRRDPMPTRSPTPRPRPGSPALKRSDSGLSNLSQISGPLASGFGESPGSPRSSSAHTSLPSDTPQHDTRRLNRLFRQAAHALLFKEHLRRPSIGPNSQKDEARRVQELPPDQNMDMPDLALELAILREILAYPLNPPSGRQSEVVDSSKGDPSPIITLVAGEKANPEGQEHQHSQKQKHEQPVELRALPLVAGTSSENIATTPVTEEAEQAHRGSVSSSMGESSISPTSSTSGGTVWTMNMSPMSLVVLCVSVGVLGHHARYLIQRGILYLREFTVLHGSILRVFYMYETVLCSPLVARSALLFK